MTNTDQTMTIEHLQELLLRDQNGARTLLPETELRVRVQINAKDVFLPVHGLRIVSDGTRPRELVLDADILTFILYEEINAALEEDRILHRKDLLEELKTAMLKAFAAMEKDDS